MPGMTIKPDPFYDRKLELTALDRAWKRHGAGGQMLLLYGRRRLGKTFLLQRYFTAGVDGKEREKPHCYFLAEQSTAATQRLTLARQLIAALPSEGVAAEDIAVSWNALLRYASQQTKERKKAAGRFALILDEFPYLVDQTPELPSILQAWWDREAVHSPLFIVLCGSQLSAMAESCDPHRTTKRGECTASRSHHAWRMEGNSGVWATKYGNSSRIRAKRPAAFFRPFACCEA